MADYFNRFLNYINDGKNLYRIYIFLVVFLCAVKLPTLLTADIQPWDEGMYATRVLSIHQNGDFFDQSDHSVGRFYSGSHPPLLIWIGYISTLIFGINSIALKIIPFIFALLSVLFLILLGRELFDQKTGVIAAMIFVSNLMFSVFAERFQFDIPYVFLVLLAFYFTARYLNTGLKKYMIYTGIVFGLCLMIKILVGFYIPLVIFGFYLFQRKKINITLSVIVLFSAIGIAIALPWHIYMLISYGNDFIQYFMGFHIVDRALVGVEKNVKGSGVFYHINYYLSIIPFAVIAFISMVKDIRNYRSLDWQKIFLWIWFLTGLIIISAFRTKLEVYVFFILVPGCLVIPQYIFNLKDGFTKEKVLLVALLIFNIAWSVTLKFRDSFKDYIAHLNILIVLLILVISVIFVGILSIYLARTSLKKVLTGFVILFFLGFNIYFAFYPHNWLYFFKLESIKETMNSGNRTNILYVGTDYKHNPQFSFYFNGLNIGWNKSNYTYDFIDTHEGFDKVKNKINSLGK